MASLSIQSKPLTAEQSILPEQCELKAACTKVWNGVQEVWGGLEKAFGVAKNSINFTLQISPMPESQAAGLKKGIYGMKLFAILNLPFNAVAIPGVAKDIFECIKLGDIEGALLSSMTFTILAADMFDSFSDVVNSSLLLSGEAALGGVIAAVGLPVVMGMIGLQAISKGVRLWNLCSFDSELEQLSTDRRTVLDFLEDKLGRLSRKTNRDLDAQTVTLLQQLKDKLVKSEDIKSEEIKKDLEQIRTSLNKDKKTTKWALAAFIIMFVAFTLFFTAVPMAVAFAMLTVGFMIRLGIWAHQNGIFKKKVEDESRPLA